jgi:hypothetical protein
MRAIETSVGLWLSDYPTNVRGSIHKHCIIHSTIRRHECMCVHTAQLLHCMSDIPALDNVDGHKCVNVVLSRLRTCANADSCAFIYNSAISFRRPSPINATVRSRPAQQPDPMIQCSSMRKTHRQLLIAYAMYYFVFDICSHYTSHIDMAHVFQARAFLPHICVTGWEGLGKKKIGRLQADNRAEYPKLDQGQQHFTQNTNMNY